MNSRFAALDHNPWPGPSSYSDPQKSDVALKFCGRENESYDVTRLIDDNIVITLYGMSGIGKSSLLNAGVFPELRKMQYLPISIRLLLAEKEESFQHLIIKTIEQEVQRIAGSVETVNVIENESDNDKEDFLWNYFARHRLYDQDGAIIFPVIVLDQFEEVLRTGESRRTSELLLRQIAYLADEDHAIEDCIVDDTDYSYDYNFRFVLSIREDDLYRLEDCLEQGYLASLKQNRYRLRGMNINNALRVVTIPSCGIISEEEASSIIEDLKDKRGDGYEIWNPAILSLYFYLFYENEKETDKDAVFADYYRQATSSIDNHALEYLEDHLLTDAGNRNLMLCSEAKIHVPEETLRYLMTSKIIHEDQRNGIKYIEFSHDRLCQEAIKQKEIRRQHATNKKIVVILVLSAIVVIIVGIFAIKTFAAKNDALDAKNDALVASIKYKAASDSLESANKTLQEQNNLLERQRDSITNANELLQKKSDTIRNNKKQIKIQNDKINFLEKQFSSSSPDTKSVDQLGQNCQSGGIVTTTTTN